MDKPILYNLSNHTPTLWDMEPFKGSINEPFPPIDPHADEVEIWGLAVAAVNQIHKQNLTNICVLGEFSLQNMIVSILKEEPKDYTLWYPCSARNVITETDGSKTHKFEFVRWRTVKV